MQESEVRRLIQRKMPQVHWQAIESRLTATGIPDLNGCLVREVWIEVKRLGVTGKSFVAGLTSRQALWLWKRSEVRGNCFILARRERMGTFHLWYGSEARALRENGPQVVEPIRVWDPQSDRDAWATMQAFMFGPPPNWP